MTTFCTCMMGMTMTLVVKGINVRRGWESYFCRPLYFTHLVSINLAGKAHAETEFNLHPVMSAPKLTKKQKKGLAFRERKGKKQDNLLDEEGAIPVADVPVDEEVNAEVPQPVIATETPATNARKRKHMGSESEGQKEKVTTEGDVEDPSKRTRKKQKVFEGGGKVDKNVTEIGKSTKAVSGNTRYILFVGAWLGVSRVARSHIMYACRQLEVHDIHRHDTRTLRRMW